MTRLFLSLGKTHGVMPKEIVGMLYREAGLPDGCLGRITPVSRSTRWSTCRRSSSARSWRAPARPDSAAGRSAWTGPRPAVMGSYHKR